jgi:hypothetical protein
MDSLPEAIQLKIYKDVHGISYRHVMEGVFKCNHKKKYNQVLLDVVLKKLNKLIENGEPSDVDEDTIQGRINIRNCLMLQDINYYIYIYNLVVYDEYGDDDVTNDLKKKLNEIQSYDLYDISTDEALEIAFDAVDQQQTDTESEPESEPDYETGMSREQWREYMREEREAQDAEGREVQWEFEDRSEPESEPERTPERARNLFMRHVPTTAEIDMEEMTYRMEVLNEHRMYTDMGCG